MLRLPLSALIVLSACKTAEPIPPEPPPPAEPGPQAEAPSPPPAPMPAGLDEGAMDLSANPCEDFYQYACGGWLARTEIPADRASWSRGFVEIADRNEQIMRGLLEAIARGDAPEGTPYADKIADYYATCMNEENLEASLPDLEKWRKDIARVKDARSLADVVGRLHAVGVRPFFRYDYTPDFKDATIVTGELDQGGLTLPDRDYYLRDDEKMREVRKNYLEHLTEMFRLLGHSDAEAPKKAQHVMDLETALARHSLSLVERRDPAKLYHRIERAGVKKAAPRFPWDAYFKTVGTPDVKQINVVHVPFVHGLNALLNQVPPAEWRSYLEWHLTSSAVPTLPKRFQDQDFAFVSRNLTGQKEDRPRWKKCVEFTDNALGFALAQPFVAQTFGANSKERTLAMVKQLEQSYGEAMSRLGWMDEPTQRKAQEKLHAIVNKIGYPDEWRRYDTLQTDKRSFLANWQNADAFEIRRRLNKIGKPTDRKEWLMTPPTVNAYYYAPLNEIVFPAGILQPPFFNREATDAVNFGSMGMVVGHELTHGFDDEGSQFDAQGNLENWWTEASREAFDQRTACVKNQYDQYTAIDELKVNGALTLGENVADLGGLKMAYSAMKAYQASSPQTKHARFTPEQQFFLGFAQSWCSKYRPQTARNRALTDPHSPPYWRVNGPLGNLPQFAEAFGCQEGSKMVRPAAERCEVW